MTVRWGVIGTGGIAHSFVRDCTAAGIAFVAVGSRTPERAEAFAAEHGIPRAYGSYEDLVAADDVDAVYVATPHSRHAEDALLAVAAGKHVLVEKAFTITADEARRVVDAARRADVAVMEAMWTRFLPQSAMIRQVIAEGASVAPGWSRPRTTRHCRPTRRTASTTPRSAGARSWTSASTRSRSRSTCSGSRRRSPRRAR